jgi:hypothetical protein
MTRRMGSLLVCTGLLALACDGTQSAAPSAAEGSAGQVARSSSGAAAVLSGSGHHTRVVGTEEDLTTFSFTAVRHADGSVLGHYQYDFRARGFAVHGKVTCVSTNGTQAWVGGTVDQVVTKDPAFESLLGLEMWWRSIDNGEGGSASPDLTTGVGFEIEGNPTTAESWCRDQPAVLPLRVVEDGNIRLRSY